MTSKEELKNIKSMPKTIQKYFRVSTKAIKKDLKILEILKKKMVNIPYLWSMIEDFESTFDNKVENVLWLYNEGLESKYHLTETDFNLIKEWLNEKDN